jgi:DNA-binding CsgD family transcriptional regulator
MRSKRARSDYLAIVEALYASYASDSEWVQAIAEVACPMLDQGLGINVWTYDLNVPLAERIRAYHSAGSSAELDASARRFLTSMPAEVSRVFYPPNPPVQVISRIFRLAAPTPEMISAMGMGGVADAFGFRGHNPDGSGIVIGAPTRGPARMAPRTKAVLTRIALHLAAAARLRQRAKVASWLDAADAVFTARGRLEHVGAPCGDPELASSALPSAVEKRLAAGAERADPVRALDLWRALVAGRWSIVDHVDRDGKRFILARRNDPAVREPAALTARQRLVAVYAAWGHSNRLIAYETGLSQSAISTELRTVLRKLRLSSRAELAPLFPAVR